MAATNGTSVLGLQILESNDPPLSGRFAIDFRNTPLPPRLSRLGTVLVCQNPVPTGNIRVFRAYKLYGGGVSRDRRTFSCASRGACGCLGELVCIGNPVDSYFFLVQL